jgi:hypothetical protein
MVFDLLVSFSKSAKLPMAFNLPCALKFLSPIDYYLTQQATMLSVQSSAQIEVISSMEVIYK